MKNIQYIVATETRTARKVDATLKSVTNTVTVSPICVTKWLTDALAIAKTMAAAWTTTEGDRVEYVVMDLEDSMVLSRYATCQTGEPAERLDKPADRLDIEWEPYDGSPADTSGFPTTEEIMARDTF